MKKLKWRGKHKVVWVLTRDRKFSVKSLYRNMAAEDCNFPQKILWKVKVLAKIKVFLWLVKRKSIVTKDSLLKGAGEVPRNVCFVVKMKLLIIYFSPVLLLHWSGVCLNVPFVWDLLPLLLKISLGDGLKTFRKVDKKN